MAQEATTSSNFFEQLFSSSKQLKDADLEKYLEKVQLRADKIVDKFVIGFFLLGLCLAPIYDTYSFSLITGGLTVILYLLARFAMKNRMTARMIISSVFAIFVLQFIGQLHGMAESHFFFFTNIAILMLYQDWRIMIPYTVLTVLHHSVLSFFQWYLNTHALDKYFITYSDVNALQLSFHYGLVGLMGVVSGISTYFFRENSIHAFKAQQLIQEKNDTLNQNFATLKETQDTLQLTLAATEAQLRAIDSTVGFVEFGTDRRILKANDNFCKILGYAPSEIEGIPHRRLVKEEYAQSLAYEDFWNTLFKGKTHFTQEFERVSKNGEIVHLYAAYSPVVINGEVVKVVKMAVDITQKKKFEVEIDAQFRAINSTVGFVELDTNRRLIKANENFCKTMGYAVDEIQGMPHRRLVSEEYAQSTDYEDFWNTLLSGEANYFTREFERITRSGEIVYLYAAYAPIILNGKVVKIIKVAVDITQKKQFEVEMQAQFRAIDGTVGFVEFDTTRRIIRVNENFCQILGYSSAEIQGLPHRRLVKDDYAQSQAYEEFWKTLLQGTTHFTQEFERVGKNGELVYLYAAYSPIVLNGKVVKIVKMAIDVTERRKIEREMQRLSLVAAKTSNGVIITDADGLITWVNASFERASGYTLAEVLGKKPAALLQGKDTNPEHTARIRKKLDKKVSFTQEILNYTKSGVPYWVELNITPILDKEGNVKQYFSIQTDITQRKRDEDLIYAQNEELAASEEELKQNVEELKATQDNLQKQFDIVATKNKNIADSINYASRIQNALLPKPVDLENAFDSHFVLFRPRDIVSGDFYWFADKETLKILVVADCTGHGVPGAFMSMLGSSLLNQIVHDNEIHEPNQILDLLHERISAMLNQNDEDSTVRDGMDATVCVINKAQKTVSFAGANNPMYVLAQKELVFTEAPNQEQIKITTENSTYLLTEIKGDKKPIGGRISRIDYQNYHTYQFKLNQAMKIYLFSDGFVDQIGGVERKKLLSKNFKTLLLSLQTTPIQTQGEALNTFFEEWLSHTTKQLDDVLVVGIELKV